MPNIRVLLVDDHPVVRAGIRNILNSAPDIEVVGEAINGQEGLRLVNELEPDVLLLDMEMPGLTGSEVARELQDAGTAVKILALSGHDDQQYIRELLAMGASGYLLKDEMPEYIVEAVRGVARGEQGWISRRATVQFTSAMRATGPDVRGLTRREIQVLREVVEGRGNKDIALALHMSEKTVEKHLVSIFSKLGVTSRVEAAVTAVREGWFEEKKIRN